MIKTSKFNKAALIEKAKSFAEFYEIPTDIFLYMIEKESSWNPFAVSNKGAQGLGQLMPGTAKELGVDNPFDPDQNLAGAARYLSKQFKRFKDWREALAAYNAGAGKRKFGYGYADDILKKSRSQYMGQEYVPEFIKDFFKRIRKRFNLPEPDEARKIVGEAIYSELQNLIFPALASALIIFAFWRLVNA